MLSITLLEKLSLVWTGGYLILLGGGGVSLLTYVMMIIKKKKKTTYPFELEVLFTHKQRYLRRKQERVSVCIVHTVFKSMQV